MGIEAVKIKLQDGAEIMLSIDDARKLYAELAELFGPLLKTIQRSASPTLEELARRTPPPHIFWQNEPNVMPSEVPHIPDKNGPWCIDWAPESEPTYKSSVTF